MHLPITPSQTIGPFLAIGLPWPDGPFVVPEGTPGAITITGRITDGADQPLSDALVETWQADPDGRFDHAGDPRGAVGSATPGFRGFGRCATDAQGRYRIVTVRPGALPHPDGSGPGPGTGTGPDSGSGSGSGSEAPHINVSVFARGLLDRVVTRIYFPDETTANAADPVLAAVPDPARRATLIAQPEPCGKPDEFRFDIHLQGTKETVFFDV